jgi:hypothetical protein
MQTFTRLANYSNIPFLKNNMKHGIWVFFFAWLLAGCEQMDDLNGQIFGDEVEAPEKSDAPQTDPPVDAPPESPSPGNEVVNRPTSKPPVTPKPRPPAPPKPTGPVRPQASAELLKIVNNWRAIPASAFPRQVTLAQPVDFVLRNASGNRVGGSTHPVGSKVFAFEQVGDHLSVGPSASSPMRSMVKLDQTDLKMVLTYAFAMAKHRQANVAMTPPRPVRTVITRPSVRPTPQPRPTTNKPRPTTNKPKPSTNKPRPTTTRPGQKPSKGKAPEGGLFDDLPEPKDLGHGKWCVCSDCRKRRLSRK